MAEPTSGDPLGQRRDPESFAEMLEQVVDARINRRLVGRTDERFKDIADRALVFELLARGWAVFRPTGQNDAT